MNKDRLFITLIWMFTIAAIGLMVWEGKKEKKPISNPNTKANAFVTVRGGTSLDGSYLGNFESGLYTNTSDKSLVLIKRGNESIISSNGVPIYSIK